MKVRNVTLDGQRYVMVAHKDWEKILRQSRNSPAGPHKQPPPLADGSYSIEHVRISLANKMISRRIAAGLTQGQLARLAGVRVETISRMENALHMPNARTFDKLDRALKRSAKPSAAQLRRRWPFIG
jgi:DNA-binding XRE family transcriptional regulator